MATIRDGLVEDVQVMGSSSVLGLLAKPIVDLAVGIAAAEALTPVTARLEDDGWIYRGDAGDQGDHVTRALSPGGAPARGLGAAPAAPPGWLSA